MKKKTKKKKVAVMISTLIMLIMMTTGCSLLEGTNEVESDEEPASEAYLKNLTTDTFYIRNNETYEVQTLYFPNASFAQYNTTTEPTNDRVLWFKEDFDSIPVMREGDSLIFYTTNILTEHFNIERFEDFGYSVGIRNLQPTESCRYKVSTDINAGVTYPGGDTDEILNHENAELIIESLGSKPLRASGGEWTDDEITEISRIGTLVGLEKGTSYKAELYEGTEGTPYLWTADVRCLGSYETYATTRFVFESLTVIQIDFPNNFNSGFYMINGAGVFRYVSKADALLYGDDYESMNTSVANDTVNGYVINYYTELAKSEKKLQEKDVEVDGKNGAVITDVASADDGTTAYNDVTPDTPVRDSRTVASDTTKYIEESKNNTFSLEHEGVVRIYITIDYRNGESVKGVVSALISPSGKKYVLQRDSSNLFLVFTAEELGTYTLQTFGLTDSILDISVEYVGD